MMQPAIILTQLIKLSQILDTPFYFSESIKNIKFNDIILTIVPNNFFKALLLRPFSKTLFWSQGIEPEECWLRENNFLNCYAKNIIEYVSLRFSGMQFLVSEAMQNHYKDKYGINFANFSNHALLQFTSPKNNKP